MSKLTLKDVLAVPNGEASLLSKREFSLKERNAYDTLKAKGIIDSPLADQDDALHARGFMGYQTESGRVILANVRTGEAYALSQIETKAK